MVGGLVRDALEQGKPLSGADPRTTFAVTRSCSTTRTMRCSLRLRGSSRKVSAGGTASARVAEQLEAARATLAELAEEDNP